jgi:hypothetical protein
MRRLVAIATTLAVCAGGSAGAAVAASAGAAAGAARAAHAAKRSKAVRCASLRRVAKQHRLAAMRRVARRRAHKLGCPTKRPQARKPAVPPAQPESPSAATAPLETTPAPPAPAAPGAPAGAGVTEPPPPPPPPPIATLGVGAYDMDGFLLRLTRTSVVAGQLAVFFRNYDVSDHNLWISSPDGEVVERISDTVGEGGSGSLTLPVTPGSWRLFCALPDHDAMTRTLTVTQ